MKSTLSLTNPISEGYNFGFTFQDHESWEDYDLHTKSVILDGKPTGQQAIVYKGNFISFRSKNYKVFPHEDLFATIDPIMEELGAEPHNRNTKDSFTMVYGKNKQANIEANHKTFNGKKYYIGSQVRANYTFKDEKFDVTGDGDIVEFGTTIENAIDGSMSMKIMPYSLRQVCSNGMMHRSSVVSISESIIANLLKKHGDLNSERLKAQMDSIMETSKSFDDLMHRVKSDRMTHLTKIPKEWITSRIYLMKESAQMFKERYRQMTEMIVTQEQAEAIARRLPVKIVDNLDWLDVKSHKVDTVINGEKQVVNHKDVTLKNITQWNAFNDITEPLTHDTGRAFYPKSEAYNALDRILVVAQ